MMRMAESFDCALAEPEGSGCQHPQMPITVVCLPDMTESSTSPLVGEDRVHTSRIGPRAITRHRLEQNSCAGRSDQVAPAADLCEGDYNCQLARSGARSGNVLIVPIYSDLNPRFMHILACWHCDCGDDVVEEGVVHDKAVDDSPQD